MEEILNGKEIKKYKLFKNGKYIITCSDYYEEDKICTLFYYKDICYYFKNEVIDFKIIDNELLIKKSFLICLFNGSIKKFDMELILHKISKKKLNYYYYYVNDNLIIHNFNFITLNEFLIYIIDYYCSMYFYKGNILKDIRNILK